MALQPLVQIGTKTIWWCRETSVATPKSSYKQNFTPFLPDNYMM